MDYKTSFFQLQLNFAEHLAAAKHLDFPQALLDYTLIFRLIGSDEQLWANYLEGLTKAEQQAVFTANFVREHRFIPERSRFGCFAYALEENDTRLRIHFENVEGNGALSKARIPARQAEMRAMLEDALLKYPNLENIRGGSWLYNLEAYRRLFPPKFLAEAYIQEEEFQFLALWGQFLLGTGEANPQMGTDLLKKAANLSAEDEIQSCFPYQVLGLLGKLSDFKTFYMMLI